MPLYTLTFYFGDNAREAELAEHNPVPENIKAKILTRQRDADDDAGIITFVQNLERPGGDVVRKFLEIRDANGRIVERPAHGGAADL